VSQADSPAQGQGFSPFTNSRVFYALTGTMLSDNQTMQFQLDSVPVAANPGQGNWNRYELTVAFTAQDTSGNLYNFSDDPEMDVQGAGN
jgi:hypothetical protein